MNKTYIKVGGKDWPLHRAFDNQVNTVDFLLTTRRMKVRHRSYPTKQLQIIENPEVSI